MATRGDADSAREGGTPKGRSKLFGRLLILAAVAVPALWLLFALSWASNIWTHHAKGFDPQKLGQFGDTFGAVNALFSGLALVGVVGAVWLQHQELEATREQLRLAREETEGNKAAQAKSDELQARQAEALLAAAKLQAANAIAQATDPEEVRRLSVSGASFYVKSSDTYRQYMKALLLDLSVSPERIRPDAPSLRAYLLAVVRDSKARGIDEKTARDELHRILTEVHNLLAQDGVSDSSDWNVFAFALVQLDECRAKIPRKQDMDESVFITAFIGALAAIESMATSMP
jgi:hypothetical protein